MWVPPRNAPRSPPVQATTFFPTFRPAIYKIAVTHAGFKTETSEAVELQVQQSLRQDFTMQVGAVTATVTVEATGALLQAENATSVP